MKKKMVVTLMIATMLIPSMIIDFKKENTGFNERKKIGFTPVDEPDEVIVVVDIFRARSLEMKNQTFFFKIFIDGKNSIWWNQTFNGMDLYFEWPMAYRTVNYKSKKEIPIQIELWKKGIINKPCDISGKKGNYIYGKSITVFYNLTTGEWYGDDYLKDSNGYGHCSGYEDGKYGEDDYEIWFDIYEGDDGDRLTYWEKIEYGLNTSIDYSKVDLDGDGIPCDWEDKYGYNPLLPEDHKHIDLDEDGLDNVEEWETSSWLSDPFAKDIFIEVDFMKAKYPWQKDYTLPKESQEMICNAFAKHNITVHFDDGSMGGGGDLIPYDSKTYGDELIAMREKYFLNGELNNWREGVFHYAIMCAQMAWYGRPAGGRMFYVDSHCVGVQYVRNWVWSFYLQGSNYITAMASVFMHELGHTLGLFAFDGIDNEKTRFPWNKEYWLYGAYKSCMNYRYVYKLVDYSNGDDEEYDQNDWAIINLRRFDEGWWR
ncbi:MAG TPA: hypothetical protein ENI53_01845 [Thermoplasmatales archaeon]|nr:hypothetical protein [Thermoplasmatales archaeon]